MTVSKEFFEIAMKIMGKFASDHWDKGEELPPSLLCFIEPPDHIRASVEGEAVGVQIIPVGELQNMGFAGKTLIAQMIHEICEKPGVMLVGYLSETWFVSSKDTKIDTGLAPSESPDRKEGALFHIESKNLEAVSMWELDRSAGPVPMVTKHPLEFTGEESNLQFSGIFSSNKNRTFH